MAMLCCSGGGLECARHFEMVERYRALQTVQESASSGINWTTFTVHIRKRANI